MEVPPAEIVAGVAVSVHVGEDKTTTLPLAPAKFFGEVTAMAPKRSMDVTPSVGKAVHETLSTPAKSTRPLVVKRNPLGTM